MPMIFATMIHGQPETVEFIPHPGRAKLQPITLPSSRRTEHRPTLQIQELVALSYGLHPKSMTSSSKLPKHVWPRWVAMYLTRQLTKRSLTAIGNAFGGRDHSTVIHGLRKVEQRIKSDPFDRADVRALREVLESSTSVAPHAGGAAM